MFSKFEGIALEDEEVTYAIASFQPCLILIPMYPHLLSMSRVVDQENRFNKMMTMAGFINSLSRAIGVIESDCVVFRKEFYARPLFDFLTFIDRYILLCILFAIPTLAAILANKSFKTRFGFYLKKVAKSMLTPVEELDCRFQILFILWITVIWIFQQYFADDMLAELTRPQPLKIIDSWADLAARPELQIIGTRDFDNDSLFEGEPGTESYFNKDMPHYSDFISRFTMVSVVATQKFDYIDLGGVHVDQTFFTDDCVLMGPCVTMRYRQFNAYGGLARDRTHVSKDGGDLVPYFLIHSWFAFDDTKDAIDLL